MKRHRGFTLVELLVVVAIVALLISLILPVASRVRETSRATVCLSNLRQIGNASLIYASKFKQYTLPAGYSHPTEKATGTSTRRDAETWTTLLVNQKLLDAPNVGSINGGISPEPSVLRCPNGNTDLTYSDFSAAGPASTGVEIPTRDHGFSQRPNRAISDQTGVVIDSWYGMNAAYNDFSTRPHPGRRLPEEKNQSNFALPRMSDIANAAQMVFIYDGIWINPYVDPDRISARHYDLTQTNILFYDGHAEGFATKDLPGGMGPNKRDANQNLFATSQIGATASVLWRLDNK